MLGIRKKVLLGFVAIGCVLLLSGAISVFEMSRMTDSIFGILSDNVKSIDAAKTMERLLYKQEQYVFSWTEGGEEPDRSTVMVDMENFEKQLVLAAGNVTVKGEKEVIEALQHAYSDYKQVLDSFGGTKTLSEEKRREWYSDTFRSSFYPLVGAIIRLADINQEALAANSSRVEKNYYHMIMPAVIAIAAGILLIIFFNYFLNCYFVNPVLRIKKGISAFLSSRMPYSVKVDTQDEIGRLNEQVTTLIEQLKKKETKDSNG